MIKINKLSASARNSEVSGLASAMETAFSTSELIDDQNLTNSFGTLKQNNEQLLLAIERTKQTSELEAYDEARDTALRALFNYINGMKGVKVDAVAASVVLITEILEKYSIGIVSEDYLSESAKIGSMLQDFSSAELTAAIDALPYVRDMVNDIESTQADFENQYQSYKKAQGEQEGLDSATQIKPLVVKNINEGIVEYLKPMVRFAPEKYGELTNTLAQMIEGVNENIKRRKKSE